MLHDTDGEEDSVLLGVDVISGKPLVLEPFISNVVELDMDVEIEYLYIHVVVRRVYVVT